MNSNSSVMTLAQQAKEIANGKGSRSAKVASLVKLGIDRNSALIYLKNEIGEAPARVKVAFTFGVEIECLMAHYNLTAAAAETGFNYQYENYNHRDGMNHFKFVSDASLSSGGIECVSPVLNGKDGLAQLKTCCKTINKAQARVDRSCGLHVHIGAAQLTEKQYSNVFANYYYLEPVIDTFMAQSRRNNRYAASIRTIDVEKFTSRADIDNAFFGDRYHKINPVSYRRHNTIEFRQHGGTTDYAKISKWVAFCGKLVEWSKKHRLDHDITGIDEIKFLSDTEKKFFKNRAAELNQF